MFKNIEYFLFYLACQAYLVEEVPIAALVIDTKKKIIGIGFNKKKKSNFFLDHAEIISLKQATKKINDWRLNGCIIFTTLEPCLMCLGAVIETRIKKIIYMVKRTEFKQERAEFVSKLFSSKKLEFYENYDSFLFRFLMRLFFQRIRYKNKLIKLNR